jgi:hypothetical protein
VAILGALQSAAIALVGRKPAQFFGSTELFETELADLINEVAEDIARYQDWQVLQAVATLSGDATTTDFDLPADYSRMMKAASVRPDGAHLWGFFRYDNLDQFLTDQGAGFRGAPGGWIITGGKMRFNPAPRGATLFPYIRGTWAVAANGTRKRAFDADTDTFDLPERLLKLALIWRWRENKKLDASGDQEAFVKALDEYAFSDGGSRVYRYRGRSSFPGTRPAWPGVLGTVEGSNAGSLGESWGNTQW